jgi:hypothetical protein
MLPQPPLTRNTIQVALLVSQLAKQRPCLQEVWRFKALSKPAVILALAIAAGMTLTTAFGLGLMPLGSVY